MRRVSAAPTPPSADRVSKTAHRYEGDPLEIAERLAPEIEAHARETEERRELAPAVFDLLLDAGFYRLLAPRSIGGFELLPSRFARVIERLARADGSTAWVISQAGGCTMAGGHLPPKVTREIFGPQRNVLAWGAGPKGKAVPVPGGYELTGSWMFASGSRHANWLGAHTFLFESDGTQRMWAGRKPAVRTLLFPADAAKVTDVWHVMGLKGTGSDNYSVERLFVPEERTFYMDGEADPAEPGVLYRFPITFAYAAGFCSVAIGLTRAMLDALLELAGSKVPHNQKVALRENAVIQSQVAQAEAKLGAARMYLHGTLQEVEESLASTGERSLTPDQRMRIRLAATSGIHLAKEAADICWRAAGSTSLFESGPFERRFRDLHAVTQQVQARQTHYETVGQFLLGMNPDPANH